LDAHVLGPSHETSEVLGVTTRKEGYQSGEHHNLHINSRTFYCRQGFMSLRCGNTAKVFVSSRCRSNAKLCICIIAGQYTAIYLLLRAYRMSPPMRKLRGVLGYRGSSLTGAALTLAGALLPPLLPFFGGMVEIRRVY
jgi:hypothetical protein